MSAVKLVQEHDHKFSMSTKINWKEENKTNILENKFNFTASKILLATELFVIHELRKAELITSYPECN